MNSEEEEYVELRKLAQEVGIKADTLRKQIDRRIYDSIPINKGKEPTKIIHGRKYCSKGLATAIRLSRPLKEMKEKGQYVAVDEYGYLNADDFESNFEFLKKKLINDLKHDDRYTSKTEKIINNIDSLFSKLVEAYKNFEPHDPLEKGTVVGVIGNTRIIAKKVSKKSKK